MPDNSRPTGVIVYPMTEILQVNGPMDYASYALMVRRTADDKIDHSEVRMVHTEGVAYKVTADKPWTWSDYVKCEAFTPTELIHFADADNGVDLADWIRTFGARLESNFSQCYRWATSVPSEA